MYMLFTGKTFRGQSTRVMKSDAKKKVREKVQNGRIGP
jgi:hypothetical protein